MIRPCLTVWIFITGMQIGVDPTVGQGLGAARAKNQSIQIGNREREYLLYVPRNVRKKMPLVFVLHGGSGNSRQIERHTRFSELARREKFIVCYPQGIEKNWNDGRGVDFIPAQRDRVPDVKFIRAVVDQIEKNHPLDRSRVFSTGISNGAFMSHRLAAEASDVFLAIAPVVGGMAAPIAEKFEPRFPVSLFVIQGDADPLVPIDGGEVGTRFGRKRGSFISTQETIDKYLKRNQIKASPRKTELHDKDPDDETKTQSHSYPPGKLGSKVQYYLIRDGGHAWPGTRPYAPERLIGKVSQDFDATEEIWKFFNSCVPRNRKSK